MIGPGVILATGLGSDRTTGLCRLQWNTRCTFPNSNNSTVTGFMIFTMGKGPIYFGPSFLQGSYNLRYFVDKYTFSPMCNGFYGDCSLSAWTFWLLVTLAGVCLHFPRHFGGNPLTWIYWERGLPKVLWHRQEIHPVATLKGVSPILLCTVIGNLSKQQVCPVRLLIVDIAMQVLFYHGVRSFHTSSCSYSDETLS